MLPMSAGSLKLKTSKRPRWLQRLIFFVGPDILFLGKFCIVLGVLVAIYGHQANLLRHVLAVALLLCMMGAAVAVAFAAHAGAILRGDRARRREFFARSLQVLRDWMPLILLLMIYENFHDLTYLVRPTIVDATLRHIDEVLFSVHPAVAMEKITAPWLTEYMTFAYMPCFFYPATILGLLYACKEYIRFREFSLALSLCFYLGLMGYMLVPAIGPRYTMHFSVPLSGYWLTERAAAAWDAVEMIKRDCFPSLHTAMTTIALIYLWRHRNAFRYGRVLLAVWVPLIVSLWCSTLYLRYHYGIDVLAGWALAYLCCSVAPAFTRWYYQKKLGTSPQVSTDLGPWSLPPTVDTSTPLLAAAAEDAAPWSALSLPPSQGTPRIPDHSEAI